MSAKQKPSADKNKTGGSKKKTGAIVAAVSAVAVVCALALILIFAGASGEPGAVAFAAFGTDGAAIRPVICADGEYRLFLPEGCDGTDLTVRTEKKLRIDGSAISDGDTANVGDGFSLSVGGKSFDVAVYRSTGLPSLFIKTESGSLDKIHADKSHKESGTLTCVDQGAVVIDSGALKYIKGRGASSWEADTQKKPYNIKFEEKTDLLGLGEAKKWNLIANAEEPTFLRDKISYDAAKELGLEFTSLSRLADLYINGEYRGVYLVVEAVEVGKQRVDIDDLDKANENANPGVDLGAIDAVARDADGKVFTTRDVSVPGVMKWQDIPADPDDVSGGYLLELAGDMVLKNKGFFCTSRSQNVGLKSPENASRAEVEYIAGLYQRAEDALFSPAGYDSEGRHYSEYFDVTSLAKIYALYEFAMESDAATASCFFYKPKGEEKFYAGPAWDFDAAYGLNEGVTLLGYPLDDTSKWLANSKLQIASYEPGEYDLALTVFTAAYRHEDFRDAVRGIWEEYADVFSDLIKNDIRELAAQTETSAVADGLLWGRGSVLDEEGLAAYYSDRIARLQSFVYDRKQSLDKGFGENAAMLYLESNSGTGYCFNLDMIGVGDSVSLPEPAAESKKKDISLTELALTPVLLWPKDGYRFVGWCSDKDGSGRMYSPGEKFTVTAKTVVLYAIWEKT